MKQMINLVTRLWRVTTACLMLAVTLITLAQVFARYVLNDSLVWSEEMNRLFFVWLIVFGAAGADHMRIGLIADTERYQIWFRWFAALAGFVALGLLIWGAYRLQIMFAFDRYITLNLSKSWYFAAAMVGGLMWGATIIYSVIVPKSEEDTTL